jgi:glutamate 5-kinase
MKASDKTEAKRVRASLARCRRIVVKIGSKALAHSAFAEAGTDVFVQLAGDVMSVRAAHKKKKQRREVVMVSSGAIALGVGHLGLKRRPKDMPSLQAAAAAGQSLLMQRYGDAFGAHGLPLAQVLLTHADLANRTRANNARSALTRLLELGALPIINENDAVAVDEITFGDNDELAAMVAPLCEADLLLLLSSVDGLQDERGRRVRFAPYVSDRIMGMANDDTSEVGRGGMRSKLLAARSAMLGGVHVVIASASEPRVIERVLAGEDVGTLLPAVSQRLKTRKHWIAYTLRPRGAAIVDAGAADAIANGGRSVLCVGVVGVRGAFVKEDPISIITVEGVEIARGLTRLSAADAARLAGASNSENSELLVHRSDLVVLPQPGERT